MLSPACKAMVHATWRPNLPVCLASRSNGLACGAPPLASGFCWAHDPNVTARRDEARRAGGRNKRRTVRAARHVPEELAALRSVLFGTLGDLRAGRIEARQATALATVSMALL